MLAELDDWSNINVMKEKTTKERILEAAEEIMLENSFHSVGLKQILDSAQVPKGSFYHYFASKEQFGAEMMKHYMAQASDEKRRLMLGDNKETSPLQRLFDYLDGGVQYIDSYPGKFPCLALKLAAEVSDFSEPIRRELTRGFNDWIDIYREILEQAIAKNLLPENLDTSIEAQFIQDLWSGALNRAVINHNSEPLKNAAAQIKAKLQQ